MSDWLTGDPGTGSRAHCSGGGDILYVNSALLESQRFDTFERRDRERAFASRSNSEICPLTTFGRTSDRLLEVQWVSLAVWLKL